MLRRTIDGDALADRRERHDGLAVPPKPYFGLGAGQRGGTVELSGVSFTELTNTHDLGGHVDAALLGRLAWAPERDAGAGGRRRRQRAELSSEGNATAGIFVQIDVEVVRVDSVENDGTRYKVKRARTQASGAAFDASADLRAAEEEVIAAFRLNFFGSPYSGSWSEAVAPGRAGGERGVSSRIATE